MVGLCTISYGPVNDAPVNPGQMSYKVLSASEVDKFLNTGTIKNAYATDGNITKIVPRQHYNRFIEYKVGENTGLNGYKMFETGNKIMVNPGQYWVVGHSCEDVAVGILNSGGLGVPYDPIPNESFDEAYWYTEYQDAWKVVGRQQYRDYRHIMSWK